MNCFLYISLLLCVSFIGQGNGLEDVNISTPLGGLRGQILTARGGHRYNAFVGVPFAENAERFEVARPVKPWEGIRDALNASSFCPQLFNYQGMEFVLGEEDCLYINVFYPHPERCLNEDGSAVAQLPVLMYIYGGGFISGYGDMYGPSFIMSQCVTLVTFNYRVGVLGFLTTEDDVIPGNIGMKDQLLALKWTRDNIQSFRGDPDKITISGQSAGGISVGHMLASPAAKGLFRAAIAHSGSAISTLGVMKNPREKAITFGNILNCNTTGSSQLKECFMGFSAEDIVKSQDKGKYWFSDPLLWGPVIELPTALEPFQTRDPYTLFRDGEFNKVPLVTGTVLEEGILIKAGEILLNPLAVKDLNENWETYAPITLYYDQLNLTQPLLDEISQKIRQFYLGNEIIGNDTFDELAHLYSDRSFNYATLKLAQLCSKHVPVYHYVFTYKGIFSFTMTSLGYTEPVVSHTDDMQYLFEIPTIPVHDPGSEQEELSQNFVNLWTSFVISGEPSGTWTAGVQWTANDNSNGNNSWTTLRLDKDMEILTNYIGERMEFWDQLTELTGVEHPAA